MVNCVDGEKPEPVTVTDVPTGPLFGERVMFADVAALVVMTAVGGCSTRVHNPVGFPFGAV